MVWILIALALVAAYVGWSLYLKSHDLRVTAVVEIPSAGEPRVSFNPLSAAPEECFRLGLAYGAKLQWVLTSEPAVALEQLRDLADEMVDSWQLNGRLTDSMPTALLVRTADRPLAAQPIERFVIRYSRTNYRSLANRSSVVNHFPVPGLSANLVWNFVVLMEAIHRNLDQPGKDRTARALRLWYECVIMPGPPDPGLSSLTALLREADYAWDASEGATGVPAIDRPPTAHVRNLELVSAYGRVLEKQVAGVLRPESTLPASKEEIKAALVAVAVELIKGGLTRDSDRWNALAVGYASLADFAPDEIALRESDFNAALREAVETNQLSGLMLSEDDECRNQTDLAIKEFSRLSEEFKSTVARLTEVEGSVA